MLEPGLKARGFAKVKTSGDSMGAAPGTGALRRMGCWGLESKEKTRSVSFTWDRSGGQGGSAGGGRGRVESLADRPASQKKFMGVKRQRGFSRLAQSLEALLSARTWQEEFGLSSRRELSRMPDQDASNIRRRCRGRAAMCSIG